MHNENPAAREKKRPMHTSLRSHSKQKATLVHVWGKLVEWLSAGRASSFVVDIAQFFAPAPQEKKRFGLHTESHSNKLICLRKPLDGMDTVCTHHGIET